MALTDTEIKKLKSGVKDYQRSDGEGLYLWVTTAGGKLWRWSYRFEGREKIISYGKYPHISLASARELHREARKLHASGIDPMAQRKAKKLASQEGQANSFQNIAEKWFENWGSGKSPRHVESTLRRLKSDVFPVIGKRPIGKIQAPELVKLAKDIEERGAVDIAKRALQTVGQVFRYAIAHGYAERNPAIEFNPGDVLKSARKVNYARIDAKDLPELLAKIEVYQGTQTTRLAIKLMALTFVRTS